MTWPPKLVIEPDTINVINKDYDLFGQTIVLPKGVTLRFEKGSISNGVLIGEETKIEGKNTGIFNKVEILGTWEVEEVSPYMFKHPEEINILKQVFALTSNRIFNRVKIPSGNYPVSVSNSMIAACKLKNHTKVELDGNINLVPNDLVKYAILGIENCVDVVVAGKGSIVGDKLCHQGKDGEWGMGINILKSKDVRINGITILDCWGDCIYIGNESSTIEIDSCLLSGSRRQGISITSANRVLVRNCKIYEIRGTMPQCAIDIETNTNGIIDNIEIMDVEATNCFGGFQVYGGAKGSYIGSVLFKKCNVHQTESTYPIMLVSADNVAVLNSEIVSNGRVAVFFYKINRAISSKNTIVGGGISPIEFRKCGFKTMD